MHPSMVATQITYNHSTHELTPPAVSVGYQLMPLLITREFALNETCSNYQKWIHTQRDIHIPEYCAALKRNKQFFPIKIVEVLHVHTLCIYIWMYGFKRFFFICSFVFARLSFPWTFFVWRLIWKINIKKSVNCEDKIVLYKNSQLLLKRNACMREGARERERGNRESVKLEN